MKNPVKQYFLFFSQGPFIFSVSALVIIPVILIISYLFIGEKAITEISVKYACIFLAVIFINMCLSYFIRGKYITTCDDDDDNNYEGTLFSVLVTKKGEKIILTKPIWKTGKKYFITANCYYRLMTSTDKLEGETQTNCHVNGKYKNSLVKIPATLTLKYNGAFNQLELFDLLIKNLPKSEQLSLDDYLEKIFNKVNEPNQPKFDEIISRYAQLLISDAEFLSELLDVVEFPERLFSCVTDTKICLGTPQTSACKGMMCEK